ncbi:protein containg parallel beta-helix repeat [Longilinea arvoryzae]|uniref:Protein containg parallel beta-helix repeat n=1 Tax=Longilinea arvoryzae TaxID=360412 RepID=A0A0S7BCJ9_9CHLR|nr:right-handed parallel beta-helix repeat-containing protein [Longilinea arvoryzae]GAP15390.1 protein containg parallel beta-helix repeat [Longilinea arvoryzae]
MNSHSNRILRNLMAAAIIAVLFFGLGGMQRVQAQTPTPQTLQVANWSDPATLTNVTGRPTVIFDGTTYHMWYTVTESGDLNYTFFTDPANVPAGLPTTGDLVSGHESSPAVLKDGNTFFMVNYTDGTEKSFSLYTSTDGIAWVQGNVIFAGVSLPGDYQKVDAPSLIQDGNGYRLYFQVKAADGTYSIYTATSNSLGGTYFLDNWNNPVLTPGASGTWDAYRLQHPMVVKDGANYYMWYVGYPNGGTQRLGFAYSSNGITWTKGVGSPIFSGRAAEPSVVKAGDVWQMWYLAESAAIKYISATGPFQFSTIQAAVNAATAGDTINVAPGVYLEEVNLNKAGLRLMGAGYETATIMGRKDTGGANTLTLAANNLLVDGFTITRDGNNVTDWADNVKTQGVIFNQSTTGSTLQNCRVTGNRNGVYLNNTQNQTVRNNIITNNRTGVQLVNNVTGLVVSENEIANNWTMGVLFNFNTGSYTTSVQITNNNISGNWYGEIQNRWAVDNGVMNVSGNWFGNTTITTSTENSSEPGYASLIPVEFGGTSTPPSTPVAIIGGVQSAMVDYSPWLVYGADTDDTKPGFQGDFFALNVNDDSPQSGAVARIQEGVDLVAVGGTVNVLAGTYTEQVTISKEITLNGDGRASIIQSFAAMPACFTTSAANRPVVCVKDTDNVTITGFTIDGLGLGNSNSRFVGVAFRNAGGTLQDNTVQDIRDTPFSGAQGGVAIYAMNDDAVARTIHVLNNTVTGFQKTGIALNASDTNPLTVDVQRNTVTGAGATTITAQNGILVWAQSGNGVVAENIISGIAYDNTNSATKWVATSILNYYTDLNTTGNTITGAHMGIYYYDGYGLIENNDLTIEKVGVYAYGINAADPPQAVPSPYDAPTTSAGISTPSGIDQPASALSPVEIANNTLTFSGADNTATYGIEADAGFDVNDLSINIHHNAVTGFENGLVFYQCDQNCSSGVFDSITAVSNDLLDNTTAIYFYGPIPQDVIPVIHHNRIFGDVATDSGLVNDSAIALTAENNWWGCNAGPADAECVGVTGPVDADPWLMLTFTADQTRLIAGSNINLTANLTHNSAGDDTALLGRVPNGLPATFAASYGTVTPASANTIDAAVASVLAVPDPVTVLSSTASVTVDNQTLVITFGGQTYIFLPFITR